MFCRLLIDNGILSCRYRLDDSGICYPVGSAVADSVDFADFADFELCFDYSCSLLSPPLILKKKICTLISVHIAIMSHQNTFMHKNTAAKIKTVAAAKKLFIIIGYMAVHIFFRHNRQFFSVRYSLAQNAVICQQIKLFVIERCVVILS